MIPGSALVSISFELLISFPVFHLSQRNNEWHFQINECRIAITENLLSWYLIYLIYLEAMQCRPWRTCTLQDKIPFWVQAKCSRLLKVFKLSLRISESSAMALLSLLQVPSPSAAPQAIPSISQAWFWMLPETAVRLFHFCAYKCILLSLNNLFVSVASLCSIQLGISLLPVPPWFVPLTWTSEDVTRGFSCRWLMLVCLFSLPKGNSHLNMSVNRGIVAGAQRSLVQPLSATAPSLDMKAAKHLLHWTFLSWFFFFKLVSLVCNDMI